MSSQALFGYTIGYTSTSASCTVRPGRLEKPLWLGQRHNDHLVVFFEPKFGIDSLMGQGNYIVDKRYSNPTPIAWLYVFYQSYLELKENSTYSSKTMGFANNFPPTNMCDNFRICDNFHS